jgi:Derlin-2/3
MARIDCCRFLPGKHAPRIRRKLRVATGLMRRWSPKVLNLPLGTFSHFRPLLLALTTVSSLIDPEARTSFYGLITFAQKWYPLVLLGLDTLNYGKPGAAVAVTGLITGYAWWTLEWKESPGSPPPGGGRIMGRAPEWLKKLIGDQTRDEVPPPAAGVHVQVPAGRALNDGGRPPPRPAATSGHNWGRGQRLGSS